MKQGNARTLLIHQLRATAQLPQPLLRAAATFTSGDVDIAAALAARRDLPEDLRASAATDTRADVRAAYLCRSDISTDELETLLADETRSGVLAPLAEHHAEHDPVALHLLWQRLLVKPTKALAVALLPSVARTIGARPGPVPLPPSQVLVALLAALGPKFDGVRTHDTQVRHIGKWLAAGDDPAAAEAVARCATAPLSIRALVAQLPHLSAGARCTLIDQVLVDVLLASPVTRRIVAPPTDAKDRLYHLPGQLDVLTEMLTTPDVQPDVIAHMRSVLNSTIRARLPQVFVAQWEADLDAYTTRVCDECPTDGHRLPTWDAGTLPTRQRQPNSHDEPGSHPAGTLQPDADSPAGPDMGADDLAALDDATLAARVPALSTQQLAEVSAIASARTSTTVACALFARLDFTESDAVALLDARWCDPPAEVLIQLVGARPGQPQFALAAAGLAPGEIVRAHGTTVFARPGAADPALDGGLTFTAAVADASRDRPHPGWSTWTDRGYRGNRELAAVAERVDVPDAVLLSLPWGVLHAAVLGLRWRQWPRQETARAAGVLARALATELGIDPARWAVFTSLADTWAGSTTELLRVCQATAAPART